MKDDEQKDYERYLAAAHAMQSGVAAKMNIDANDTTPKHLRVGINSAMSDNAALVSLLIEKGLISSEEYTKAIADQMEKERDSYARMLSEHYGKEIKLG